MSIINEYLLSISAAALLTSVAASLVVNGNVGKIVNCIVMLILVLVVFVPVAKINVSNIARSIAMFRMDLEQEKTGIEVNNREILAELIKEKCEAYILDKAETLGVTIQADITISEEGGYPYPVHIRIIGRVSAEDRAYLQRIIEEDIGIPSEQQEWG